MSRNIKVEKFCPICDSSIERKTVDGMDFPVCMKCSQIEGGYVESERGLVSDLRSRLTESDHYLISSLLMIFRKHQPLPKSSPAPVAVEREKMLHWIDSWTNLCKTGGIDGADACPDCELRGGGMAHQECSQAKAAIRALIATAPPAPNAAHVLAKDDAALKELADNFLAPPATEKVSVSRDELEMELNQFAYDFAHHRGKEGFIKWLRSILGGAVTWLP